jgi:hypothetical protein
VPPRPTVTYGNTDSAVRKVQIENQNRCRTLPRVRIRPTEKRPVDAKGVLYRWVAPHSIRYRFAGRHPDARYRYLCKPSRREPAAGGCVVTTSLVSPPALFPVDTLRVVTQLRTYPNGPFGVSRRQFSPSPVTRARIQARGHFERNPSAVPSRRSRSCFSASKTRSSITPSGSNPSLS